MMFDCWPPATWEFILSEYVRESGVGSPSLPETSEVWLQQVADHGAVFGHVGIHKLGVGVRRRELVQHNPGPG